MTTLSSPQPSLYTDTAIMLLSEVFPHQILWLYYSIFKRRNYVSLFSKRTYMHTWYTDELQLLSPGFGLAVLLLAWWTTSFCHVTLNCLCGLSSRFLMLHSTPIFSPRFVWCLPYLAWVLTPQPHIPRQKHWLAAVPSAKEWFQLSTKTCVNKVATWMHQTHFRRMYMLSFHTFP